MSAQPQVASETFPIIEGPNLSELLRAFNDARPVTFRATINGQDLDLPVTLRKRLNEPTDGIYEFEASVHDENSLHDVRIRYDASANGRGQSGSICYYHH